MPVFNSQFRVRAAIDVIYEFHRNARNLGKVQPPYPRILEFRGPELLNTGDTVEVELGPIPRQSWKAKVEELLPPHGEPPRALMIDTAFAGPFPFFRHRHAFAAEGPFTWVRDTIDFDLPGGRAGSLLFPFAWVLFFFMFHYRKRQTRRTLEIPEP